MILPDRKDAHVHVAKLVADDNLPLLSHFECIGSLRQRPRVDELELRQSRDLQLLVLAGRDQVDGRGCRIRVGAEEPNQRCVMTGARDRCVRPACVSVSSRMAREC